MTSGSTFFLVVSVALRLLLKLLLGVGVLAVLVLEVSDTLSQLGQSVLLPQAKDLLLSKSIYIHIIHTRNCIV